MTDKKELVRLMMPVGRLINHSLFEKDVYTDERGREATPSYKVEQAYDEGALDEFEDAIIQAAIEFFGADAEADYDAGRLRSPILFGDDLAEERARKGKNGEAYEGMMVVRAKTIFNRDGVDAPGGIYVCNAAAEELDFAERRTVYNGSYGKASVTVNPYKGIAGGQPGIGLYLNGFQFIKDGERLRGSDPSSLFSPMMGEKSENKGRRARKG